MVSGESAGPLRRPRVPKLGGIGPVPFAAMPLVGIGAPVLRSGRPDRGATPWDDEAARRAYVLARGRKSVALYPRNARACETVPELVDSSDVSFKVMRPGVTGRLGLDPATVVEHDDVLREPGHSCGAIRELRESRGSRRPDTRASFRGTADRRDVTGPADSTPGRRALP